MNWSTITPSLIGFVGIIIGYLIKYFLDKKARFSTETATIKRDMYKKYIDFIMQFVNNPENQASELSEEKTVEVHQKMREFHREAILYSSPRVINAFADFLQYAYKHPDGDTNFGHMIALVTNVFREMRRDIGLSNLGLRSGSVRLIRPIINDYDQIIAPVEFSILGDAKRAASATKKKEKKRKK